MSRIFKKNPKLNDLRDRIKEYAVDTKLLRTQAREKTGPERHALKQDAKYIGSHHTRHHLLAYGLLRGKTREQIEGKSKTKVNETYLRQLLEKYAAPEIVEAPQVQAVFVEATSG